VFVETERNRYVLWYVFCVSFLIHSHHVVYHITYRIQKPSLHKLGKKKDRYFVASATAFVGDNRS
jgi:hypothetical protein